MSDKLQLWYCDTFVNTPWLFALLIIPVIGAYFYGQDKKKIAWTLIGSWAFIQILFSFLTNILFNCSLE